MSSNSVDLSNFDDELKLYYKKLFPYNTFYRWLSYGNVNKANFTHRELSFTLPGDIYIRFQSFEDEIEFEKEILKKCPIKIDIGPVYNTRPKDKNTSMSFEPQEKELVFDIDITDYDDVRTCCKGADICLKCWPLMTIAIKVIDRALRADFGFEHIMWVYSGRRGVHCWVCDEEARKLTGVGRSAIAEYLTVVKGGDQIHKKVNIKEKVHPSIQEATKIVKSFFQDLMMDKQEIFANENYHKIMALIPENQKELMKNEFTKHSSHEKRWQTLQSVAEIFVEKNFKKNANLYMEIILQFCYPRLDINVTKGLNHLLKSPFCVHPKTGRVCIPIDPKHAESFDPFTVPTINQLSEELNLKLDAEPNIKDYKKTSLAPSIAYFEKFVKKLELSLRIKKDNNKENSLEF